MEEEEKADEEAEDMLVEAIFFREERGALGV